MIPSAGPYRSGTNGDPARIAHNVDAMEAFALPIRSVQRLDESRRLGEPRVRSDQRNVPVEPELVDGPTLGRR
jgi:hypothetical protein